MGGGGGGGRWAGRQQGPPGAQSRHQGLRVAATAGPLLPAPAAGCCTGRVRSATRPALNRCAHKWLALCIGTYLQRCGSKASWPGSLFLTRIRILYINLKLYLPFNFRVSFMFIVKITFMVARNTKRFRIRTTSRIWIRVNVTDPGGSRSATLAL